MRIHDVKDNKRYVDVSLNEGLDTVVIGLDPSDWDVELDEQGINLLIEGLRSAAEDMKRHREHAEAQRLQDEGRLH